MLALPAAFVVAAWLAHFEVAPDKASATPQPYQPLVKRPQVDPLAHPVDTTAVLRSMEKRMLAPNPPLPRRSYSGEEMEKYSFKFRMAEYYCDQGTEGVKYAFDWARDEPEQMFAWLREKDGGFVFQSRVLFELWAEADVEGALAGALQIPNTTLRAQALMTTLGHLAKADPDRARRLLADNSGLFTVKVAKDIDFGYGTPVSSWQIVQSLPPGAARSQLEYRFLESTPADTASALWNQASEAQHWEWVSAGFPSSYSSVVNARAFAGLGELLRTRAETTRNADDVKTFLDAHGAEWASQDLAAASTWAMNHCQGKAKRDSLESLYSAAMARNPDQTIEVWRQLPESYLKKNLAKAILANAPEGKRAEVHAALQRP
jgi:hypothetical protein